MLLFLKFNKLLSMLVWIKINFKHYILIISIHAPTKRNKRKKTQLTMNPNLNLWQTKMYEPFSTLSGMFQIFHLPLKFQQIFCQCANNKLLKI